MPSFSTEVKNELARLTYNRQCCQKAELAGLLRMGASLVMGGSTVTGERCIGVSFVTENAAVARKVLHLIKSISKGNVVTEVTVSRSRRLKKNNRYSLRTVPSVQVRELLVSLGLMMGNILNLGSDIDVVRKKCCRIAYLRGAFMGGGTVNRPEASCHLEFVTGSYNFGATINNLLRRMEMPAGFIDRHNDYVIYLKDGEAILDLLGLMGADKSVEALEVARNLKELRSQINRIVNCETANLEKTVNASIHHIEIIEWLEKNAVLKDLPAKLQESAKIRQENPEASLSELAEILNISKSGFNHRMKKLEEIYNEKYKEYN